MSDKSVLQLLLEFNLTDIEARIYLYLLNKDPHTILELSRILGIPRTSIYDGCLRLIDKGLLEKNVTYKSQKVSASPLSILESIIEKEKEKIKKLESSYEKLEKIMTPVLDTNMNTQVRYYHGAQGIRQMMWNSLSAKGGVTGYSELGRVDIVGLTFFKQWSEEIIQRKITDRVILNPNNEAISYLTKDGVGSYRKHFQTTRIIDTKYMYISGDTMIYNNVYAVSYWKYGEVVGVEIENLELLKSQKSIFETLWNLATPLNDIY